jgi:hypothetical protein
MKTAHTEYITAMKHQLDLLNGKIDELEAQAHAARDSARDRYQAELVKVRHQSSLAMTQFDQLKESGEDKWDRAVDEMVKIRDAFTHSFQYFQAELDVPAQPRPKKTTA